MCELYPGLYILPIKGRFGCRNAGALCMDSQTALFWKEEKMEQNRTKDNDMRLVSISEACKLLGIGQWSIYQQINRNMLKTVRIGTRRLIPLHSIKEFIRDLEDGCEA